MANKREVAITTIDNPYDPLDEFEKWYLFDIEQGYNTCAYLARLTHTSDKFTDKENDEEIERAIDEILLNDFTGMYRKVIK